MDRYHGTRNPYPLPNDEKEKKRLDKQHCAIKSFIGENIVVPILQSPTQIGKALLVWTSLTIVDAGTGYGAWVFEIADRFPRCLVFGIDLSPIQPGIVPLNAEFIVTDLNDRLNFDNGSTDLVHSR
jgi:SAM-dependent methyltransferase